MPGKARLELIHAGFVISVNLIYYCYKCKLNLLLMKTSDSAPKPQDISLDDIRNITVGKPDEEAPEEGACDIRRPEDCED